MEKKCLEWTMKSGVIICLAVLVCLCSGCTYTKELKQNDPFLELYNYAPAKKQDKQKQKEKEFSLSLSVKDMSLSTFCRILSDKTGAGVVYTSAVAGKVITGEFKQSTVAEILNCISRQLNIECVKLGKTFFLGKMRNGDRGVLVKRVRGFTPEKLKLSIKALLSEGGKCEVFENGIIVVSDREHVLQRVSAMCNYIEEGGAGSWIVQLYFVAVRKDALIEAGLDVKSSGAISYNISDSTVKVDDLKLDGLFNLVSRSSFADMYASPMLLLRDGVKGTWKDGERIPIPKKIVSQYGVVTTEGFIYVETGLLVDCMVRESKQGAVLKVNITLSDVKGYVEYAPITAQCAFNVESEIKQNKLYLLGEMARYKQLDTQKKILNLGSDSGKSTIQVWCKVYRVAGGCKAKILKPQRSIVKGIQSLL